MSDLIFRCQNCGTPFEKEFKGTRYCSPACREEGMRRAETKRAERKVSVSAHIPVSLYAQLQEACYKKGISITELIRRLIIRYCDKLNERDKNSLNENSNN